MNIMKHIPMMLGAVVAFSSCQQQNYPIAFLTESPAVEAGAAFNILFDGTYYNRMPMFSLKHFSKFKSFLSGDGSYGIVLYTKEEYRARLYTQTLENVGKKVLPVMDGHPFPPMLIDRPISDGKLVIWEGVNGYDLKMLSYKLTPVNPEIEEKRYKKENPRPRPQVPIDAKVKRDAAGRAIPQLYSR